MGAFLDACKQECRGIRLSANTDTLMSGCVHVHMCTRNDLSHLKMSEETIFNLKKIWEGDESS